MAQTTKLLRRVSDREQLRAAGLTEDEIDELKGIQKDRETSLEEHITEMEKAEEFCRLKTAEENGTIDEDDQKKLDRQTGVFWTFDFNGETIRVNHCIVSRVIIMGVIFCFTLYVIYLCSFKPMKIVKPVDLKK